LNFLSGSFRVIALDPRGQGLSEDSPNDNYVVRRARDIFELMGNEHIDSCILAGWSLGALDVLSFLENFGSKKLIGLVLIDGPITTEDEGLQTYFKSSLNSLQTNRKEFEDSFLSWLFQNMQDTVLLNIIRERVRNTPTNSSFVALGTHVMKPKDFSGALENTHVPVLVTIAQFDFQLENYKKIKGNIVIENFGSHTLFLNESERFNKLVVELYERSRIMNSQSTK
jgi:microsomal epoxide hydrolase